MFLERMNEAEAEQVQAMIQKHAYYTDSDRARRILAHWDDLAPRFVKVMPKDYKRMLEALTWIEQAGLERRTWRRWRPSRRTRAMPRGCRELKHARSHGHEAHQNVQGCSVLLYAPPVALVDSERNIQHG